MTRVKSLLCGQSKEKRRPWRQSFLSGLIPVLLLASCATQKPLIPAPLSTPRPESTNTVFPQTATAAPDLIDIGSGGFTLVVQPGLEFEAHDDSISISDRRGELVVSLNGRPYIASSYTLQSFLGKYLAEMASRGGSFEQGEPYEIVVDGQNGLAIDFSGNFLDNPVAGKAIAVSPGKDFIVFGLGMSLLNDRENGWTESGSMIFETVLESIHFKDEVK
jgi:hypothetical protein